MRPHPLRFPELQGAPVTRAPCAAGNRLTFRRQSAAPRLILRINARNAPLKNAVNGLYNSVDCSPMRTSFDPPKSGALPG